MTSTIHLSCDISQVMQRSVYALYAKNLETFAVKVPAIYLSSVTKTMQTLQ